MPFLHEQLEGLEILTEPVWVFDVTTRLIAWANSAAVRLWDAKSREELLARDCLDVSEVAAIRLRDYVVRFQRGETIRDLWTIYTHTQKPITVHCSLRGYLLAGGHVGILAHAHTTNRESANVDALRFVEALRHTAVLVSLHSMQGELIIQNPESLDAFGSGRGLVARFADAAEGARVLKVLSERELFAGEAQMSTVRGLRWYDIKALRTPDPATGQPAILVSASDITERRNVEHALAMAKQKAEAAVRAKSDFLAMMSHEIRTPMNGVMGLVHLLSLTELSREQHALCDTIYESTQALVSMVSDILDFSRLEAGRFAFDACDMSLDEIVDNVLTLLANHPSSARLDLFSFTPRGLPKSVRGDSGKLRQVLLNLCSNAVKFTEQGAVGVRMAVEEQTEGRCLVRFEIKDTGAGIPSDMIARLFHRFEQVDSSMGRRYGGTGLGLAISHKLVALMGGRIGVASELGVGSTFWFTLPFGLSGAGIYEEELSLAGQEVVVAIPHPLTRDTVAQELCDLGAEVIPVATGTQAVRVLTSDRRPSLLIARSQLSDMSAKALHAHLVEHGRQVPTLVIIKQTERAALHAPDLPEPLSILVEPITYVRLCSAIRQVQSSPGTGAREQSAGERGGPPVLTRLPQSLRVLVAEDNPINQRVLQGLLTHMGACVTIASDGRQAVELAASDVFDVILMDMHMPNLSGLEATRCIRTLPGERGHVPVIALTANASASAADACHAAGMQSYLTKPVAADELRNALAALCPG